jgi:hypothetical protein
VTADAPPSTPPAPRKNAGLTRGKPFQPGNPGRRKGSRNPTKAWLDSLTDDDHAVAHAKMTKLLRRGDRVMVRLYLGMRKVVGTFKLPKSIDTLEDVDAALSSVAKAQAAGELAPDEATAALATIGAKQALILSRNLEPQLREIEKMLADMKGRS